MKLFHSSGIIIERNVELILRDPAGKVSPGRTEVLVCQFGGDVTEKWLLFAPVSLDDISARTGDAAGEIVVMIRGADQHNRELREILVLGSATAAGFEWVQMLGLIPIPPEGPFANEPYQPHTLETLMEEGTLSSRWQTPMPTQATPLKPERTADVFSFLESETGSQINQEPVQEPRTTDNRNRQPRGFGPAEGFAALPPDFAVMPFIPGGYQFMGGDFQMAGVSPDKEYNGPETSDDTPLRHSPSLHTLSDSKTPASSGGGLGLQRSRKANKSPQSRRNSVISYDEDSRSHAPSEASSYLSPAPTTLSRTRSIHLDDEARPTATAEKPVPKSPFDDMPNLSPSPKPPPTPTPVNQTPKNDVPPPVPPHRVPTTSQARNSDSPSRSPAIPLVPSNSSLSSTQSGFNGRRRTSSPLKHEYDPSSPSESGSGSGSGSEEEEDKMEEVRGSEKSEEVVDEDDDDDQSGSSGSSESSSEGEESDDAVSICSEEEDGDYPPPMLSIPRRVSKEPSGVISLPRQRPSSLTLASSAPTPHPTAPTAFRFRALVFAWSINQWEKLHPNECGIAITSGHIEGFPATSPHSTSGSATPEKLVVEKDTPLTESSKTQEAPQESLSPIFSLDLNPTTPVRRGTAVDISIRTPPNSKFAGASLMLRCRSPAECETLYTAINNNRTLPVRHKAPSTLLSSLISSEMTMISEASSNTPGSSSVKRGWGSWGRSKTYRAGITDSNPGSIISSGPSETSVGSISSAFSRFRQNNRMFKSSHLDSIASSSSSTAGDSRRGSPPALNMPAVDGHPVFKIRLYRRENASKWRDLGNSRLSILKPTAQNTKQQNSLSTGEEKRIVVMNKAGTNVFLDEVLGESSFERVARTGIAVSVLVGEGADNGTGVPGGVGGIGAKSIVYMMQVCVFKPLFSQCSVYSLPFFGR